MELSRSLASPRWPAVSPGEGLVLGEPLLKKHQDPGTPVVTFMQISSLDLLGMAYMGVLGRGCLPGRTDPTYSGVGGGRVYTQAASED